jgi:hypothetical protein
VGRLPHTPHLTRYSLLERGHPPAAITAQTLGFVVFFRNQLKFRLG